MKVFISWSGDLSHRLAEEFRVWLPGALQAVQPYCTLADIEKGARWGTEITKELEASDVGILFMTRENLGSPWLLYEAGALSKRLEKSKVCPIVFGISHNDLPGPLRQFQASDFKEVDFKKLLKTINAAAADNRLPDAVLDRVFEMWWPGLEEKFNAILSADHTADDKAPIRQDREILEEILELARLISRRGSRTASVGPGVIHHLVTCIMGAARSINESADLQAALRHLEAMQQPLEYLASRAVTRSDPDIRKALEELGQVSFEYTMPDPEDEIPF